MALEASLDTGQAHIEINGGSFGSRNVTLRVDLDDPDCGPAGWAYLTPAEARQIANALREAAAEVEKADD